MIVLNVKNLTKNFKKGYWPLKTTIYTAVNNVSFSLDKGEVLGFLGHNGAGKTTTIQMLLGTLTPSGGSITYFGKDFNKNFMATLEKVGYASGYDKLPARLTVMDNLDIVGRIYKIPSIQRATKIEKLLKFFGVWDLRDNQTGGLSAGQATRVMLAKAFINDPEIVLLDEPTASLDPDIAQQVRQFILAQSKEKNTSILITSHNMDEVTELCDRVLVLKKGQIVANNTPEELARSTSKVRVHLTITKEFDAALFYIKKEQLIHSIYGKSITVEIDEQNIANFLLNLSELKVIYSHISIDKPTLEDYFLNLTKGIS